ncbi:hypothetical protein TCAL_06792 [Tigriopus californicus]|uniref:Uncharacterized protein n=1 Tax=Tigriopus californicus TaxID=6832 RepID=A0A553PM14_TIGCA|nr:hypothetical protein TCAL_06792 [Tigriopus californicus]|eukprot:TCALIF_06792-PA protein Name:"Protein of unknown function" AED:0.02 eAED:0.02 QI:28/0.66/0.5/1/0.33/0.25/4/0/220
MELVWMVMLLSFILVGSFHTGHTLGQNGTRAQSSRSPSRRAELPVELQKYAEIHFSHLSAKDLGQTEMDNDNDVEHWRKNLEKRQSWRKNKTSILETIFMKAKVALLKKQEHEEAETNTSNATQPRHRFSNGSCFHDGQIHKNGSQVQQVIVKRSLANIHARFVTVMKDQFFVSSRNAKDPQERIVLLCSFLEHVVPPIRALHLSHCLDTLNFEKEMYGQ